LLELGTDRSEEAFLSFELDLLRETGYLAELHACVVCGRDALAGGQTFFSPARGGAVCRNCEMSIPDRLGVDPRLLRMVQGLLRLPRTNGAAQRLPRLTRRQTDPINKLLAEHVEHTLGRRLRMARWVT
jgi:DNA repair protein RecO (recombination protein O)